MTELANSALVRVRDLRKQYVQRRPLTRVKFTVPALDGVDLTVRRGTTLALVGESGSGKSTLARCLALIEKPSAGEIWWNDVDLITLNGKQFLLMRRRIQMIFQDPASALNPGMTASEIIEEPLAIQAVMSKREQHLRALELMDRVGLQAKFENKRPFEFSGGQRQRLTIARALALEPQLLILDEALSNLDLANQNLVLQLLTELQASYGLTYLHVLHDLNLAADLADEVAVMHEGRVVEQACVSELFKSAQNPHTLELLTVAPDIESILAERNA